MNAFPGVRAFVSIVVLFAAHVPAVEPSNWQQWRGPDGTGVAKDADPPVQWSAEQNIRWKTKLPGRGHSTPIVWGERIFVTAAVPVGEKLIPKMSGRPGEHDNLPIDREYAFTVIALNRNDGSIEWQKVLHSAVPVEAGHHTGSLASASSVTDGVRVYAYFGSHGLYCLDFDGNPVWQRDFGQMHSKHGHGEGASQVLSGDSLIVNWDHEEGSFLVSIDKTTGKNIWRRDRREDTSWSSPITIQQDGKMQVVVCGTNRVRGYDLANGDVIWECGGMSSNIVATPVFANGFLYVGSSYEKKVLMGIDVRGAAGDLTGTDRVVWERIRGTPYVPSMLLYENQLYFLSHYQNILTRIEATTGKDAPGAMRLGSLGNIYASPVAAGGHVYITDLQGTTEVVSHSPIPRTVAVNQLAENVNASLAIVDRQIFIRGETHLYCIAEP